MKNIKEKYLLLGLHDALVNGRLSNNSGSSVDFPGVYLVVFRIIHHHGKINIIYHYMPYSDLFTNTLLLHLIMREDFINSTLSKEWGDFFTFIDYSLKSDDELVKKTMESPDDYNRYSYPYLQLDSNDIVNMDILNISKKFVTIMDDNEMSLLLNLAYKKDFISFFNFISRVPISESKILNIIDEDYNLLYNCLFVVKNLDDFLEKVKESTKLPVNQGPQSKRGLVNSMSGFLYSVDEHYRESLFQHHKLHFPGWNSGLSLYRKEFSYKNIHMNLGNVRWYSTKREIKSKLISSKELVNKAEKSIQKDSLIFNQLSNYIKNSPINEDTQLKIEKFLCDYSYILYKDRENNKLPVNYKLISSKLTELLKTKESDLNTFIDNLRCKMFKTIPKSHSLLSQYYLNILLKEINNSLIISMIYGRLLRIISNFKNNIENVEIDVCLDLGEDLVRNYYFNLYSKVMLINIRLLIKECDDLLNNDISYKTESIILALDKVKKLVKKKELDVSNLIFYSKNLTKKIKIISINKNNIVLNNIIGIIQNYTLSDWKNGNNEIINKFDNNKIKNLLGAKLVDWMADTDLVKIDLKIISKKDRYNVIEPLDNVLNKLKDFDRLLHLPRKIPMIVKPKPYFREKIGNKSVDRLGGYLLNDELYTDNLIIDNWELKEPSTLKDDSILFNIANNLNSVGYKINKDILNFIEKYGYKYNLIIDKNYKHPLLTKSKLNKSDRTNLESFLSKRVLQENILGLAEVLSNVHEFFIPVRVDFRGRVDCISEYLNYQSNDLAKSLLLFSKSEKIFKSDNKAIGYFKAYGANCFGNKLDKESWNSRIKWVDVNIENIINFKNGILISQSENKLLFIAFCFEYNRWLQALSNNDIPYFETYLPIRLDATCNGYQHLAMLSLDCKLAKEVNLTYSSWKDKPKDFYSYSITKLIEYFKNKLKSNNLNEDDIESYNRLSKLNIQRYLLKKGLMTWAYSITIPGMTDDLLVHFEKCNSNINKDITNFQYEWYQLLEDSNIKLRLRDINYISKGISDILQNDVFKLAKLIKYLRDTAKICTRLGLYIPWSSPDTGIDVKQSYLVQNETKLKPFTYSKNKFSIRIPDKTKYNNYRQIRATMPNLVHTLDAASLALLTDLYFNNYEGKNLFSVHDCFAVTANNVDNLMQILKYVYQKIYTESNYLRKFDKGIKDHILFHYPNCFNIKTRIIEQVINSKTIKMEFPNIDVVLDTDLDANVIANLIRDSSYLIM